jgi:hypothetical protein
VLLDPRSSVPVELWPRGYRDRRNGLELADLITCPIGPKSPATRECRNGLELADLITCLVWLGAQSEASQSQRPGAGRPDHFLMTVREHYLTALYVATAWSWST